MIIFFASYEPQRHTVLDFSIRLCLLHTLLNDYIHAIRYENFILWFHNSLHYHHCHCSLQAWLLQLSITSFASLWSPGPNSGRGDSGGCCGTKVWNSVLEKFIVSRFAVIQLVIRVWAFWRWSMLESKSVVHAVTGIVVMWCWCLCLWNEQHGRVVSVYTTDSQYEVAVIKVLGHNRDAIVCDTTETAQRAIDYLKIKMHPPQTFLPLNNLHITTTNDKLDRYDHSLKYSSCVDIVPSRRHLQNSKLLQYWQRKAASLLPPSK